jgi:hypothetical protein
MERPASVSERRWQALIAAAGHFINRWAKASAALGWTTTEIFGCHPTHPEQRIDLQGLLWLIHDGWSIRAVAASLIELRTQEDPVPQSIRPVHRPLSYRHPLLRPGEPQIAIWELA